MAVTETYEHVLFDVADGLATITLNRPDKLNAWTPTMEAEVRHATRLADGDAQVRAIIITGAGRGFCAGADLSPSASTARPLPAPPPGEHRFHFLHQISKPLVAAINGPAAGVGLSISLYCDFRYMAEDTKLTTAFARRGLIAEHGSAWLLPRLIGPQNAADLLLSGRNVSTAEAAQMGLVRPLPADGFLVRVREVVAEMIGLSSPRSMRVIKQQLRQSLEQSFADAATLADREQAASMQSADFKEGFAAFLQRRPPAFTGA